MKKRVSLKLNEQVHDRSVCHCKCLHLMKLSWAWQNGQKRYWNEVGNKNRLKIGKESYCELVIGISVKKRSGNNLVRLIFNNGWN